MKRIFTLCMILCTSLAGFAQVDTTAKQENKADTIHIGGMIIIRDKDGKNKKIERDTQVRIRDRRRDKPSNLSTNWWIFDIGFSNWVDNSDYGAAAASGFVAPGITEEQMKLKTGKSRNVNIWVFMQRLNIAKHVLNLKYGLGLELNNYHFDYENILFLKNPTFISQATEDFDKVKLAADYITVPLMLNINFTPRRSNGFGISAGISAGYLYSARYKVKVDDDVDKLKDDFDLERFKLSYIGEISLGPVRLYGSYALDNMWDKGLDMTPYTLGLRFSNW
jgi:hypothetical protein